jgi:hypothetical protein
MHLRTNSSSAGTRSEYDKVPLYRARAPNTSPLVFGFLFYLFYFIFSRGLTSASSWESWRSSRLTYLQYT